MLTGARAFEGDHVTDTLAAVIRADPDESKLPVDTPPRIRRLLRWCLQKNRRLRVRDIADVRNEIDEAQKSPSEDASRVPAAGRRERLVLGAALAVVTLIAGALGVVALRPAPLAPELRLEIGTTGRAADDNTGTVSLAISPDGEVVAFVATAEGVPQLWLRPLRSTSARPLSGTGGAILPFWSPDSRSIGFFADGKLKRIDIDSGSVQVLSSAPVPRGGAWNRDGTILFTSSNSGPILRVAAAGGEAVVLTRMKAGQQNHLFPRFAADGRQFIFYVQGAPATRGVYVGHVDGRQPKRLLDADAAAVYAPGDRLLFVRQRTLFAQTFDPERLEVTGRPFPVAEQVAVSGTGSAAVSASAVGPIVYRAGLVASLRQFVWIDRSGRETGRIGEPIGGVALNPALSPDGRRLAMQRTIDGSLDIWLLDVGRGTLSRLVADAALDVNPLWSPDGRSIVFGSSRKGAVDLYLKSTAGTGSEELLLASSHTKSVTDWSLDGRWLLYRDADPKSGFDLWALRLEGDRKPFPVLQTNAEERDAQFSPDGKWIAYGSNESGRYEIYVQPFPGPGAKSLISTSGGGQPRWRRDGRELFYIALDGRLTAVPIQLDANAQTVEAGAPVALFQARIGTAVPSVDRQQYVVSADGQRFLLNTLTEEALSPIVVILNWQAMP